MPVDLCKQCGYRWNHPHRDPDICPSCRSQHWNEEPEPEAESCDMDGGICDQCETKFFVIMREAQFCPHCGSKDWDSGKQTPNNRCVEHVPKRYRCLKCGHVTGVMEHVPARCGSRKFNGNQYCGSRKFEVFLK